MGRRRSIVANERKRQQLLERLMRMRYLIDLLKLRSFEIAAMYARARADDGHDTASSIVRISVNCHSSEAEAAGWIAIGETMLSSPDGSGAIT
jgi:hypothetical protein